MIETITIQEVTAALWRLTKLTMVVICYVVVVELALSLTFDLIKTVLTTAAKMWRNVWRR